MEEICQIQVAPADNGYYVQGVNVDGAGGVARVVASSKEQLRVEVKKLADLLYTKIRPPQPGNPTTPIAQ